MSGWEISGDAEFTPDASRSDSGSDAGGTELGESARPADSPTAPQPTAFRQPGPHEQVPGYHIAYSAHTHWCRACTERYGAPILWPCATYDYQEARDQFERDQWQTGDKPPPGPAPGSEHRDFRPPSAAR